MSRGVTIVPLTTDKLEVYIAVGKKSYLQHYLDFWIDRDPSPYINESFTREVLTSELKNANAALFIVYSNARPVGIAKVVIDQAMGNFSEEEALLLQKIYILKKYSKMGIGSKVLTFVEHFAKEKNKKVVWLDTMVEGRATPFYQKNGFEVISEKQLHYKNIKDEKRGIYVMTKKLKCE